MKVKLTICVKVLCINTAVGNLCNNINISFLEPRCKARKPCFCFLYSANSSTLHWQTSKDCRSAIPFDGVPFVLMGMDEFKCRTEGKSCSATAFIRHVIAFPDFKVRIYIWSTDRIKTVDLIVTDLLTSRQNKSSNLKRTTDYYIQGN